ncbi:sigma-70 family RNA polymerase sigma factor [Ruania alkalisoli]|uniref:Sigma-70 family RNA polymerase sigma factor n=1 Tax=Ruania alkalisoli TaxID=2779775 RepID=A0A7M1SR33_9MICO|nr:MULTISPECIES: sigma-70 family RNA polymerase sigma factor [Ruania]QOR69454.1 sigma-70 family RNA polymerase sigma factor [Ruania alkalisoli]
MDRTAQQTVWATAAEHYRRWRAGSPTAMDELVRCLTPVLWQVVRAQRLDAETASDVVQTTWLALVRRPDAVREPEAVGSWLVTTARREAWRVVKAGARTELMEELPETGEGHSAEQEATTRWLDRLLWRSVSQLSQRCQRLLRVAAFLDRPNYRNLAGELDMPVGSIGPTRARCLARLRTLLAAEGVDHA